MTSLHLLLFTLATKPTQTQQHLALKHNMNIYNQVCKKHLTLSDWSKGCKTVTMVTPSLAFLLLSVFFVYLWFTLVR